MNNSPTMSTSIEHFCRGFLHHNPDYRHLYDILDDYSEIFLQIELDFHDKETFSEAFSAICFTVIRVRNLAAGGADPRAYVLAILGFASHVHRQCKNSEWYDIDTMIITLVDILTFVNFNPSDFCKRYYCCIL